MRVTATKTGPIHPRPDIHGYLAFGEAVDIWTWMGATVIFSGITYITYRERELAKPLKTKQEENDNNE